MNALNLNLGTTSSSSAPALPILGASAPQEAGNGGGFASALAAAQASAAPSKPVSSQASSITAIAEDLTGRSVAVVNLAGKVGKRTQTFGSSSLETLTSGTPQALAQANVSTSLSAPVPVAAVLSPLASSLPLPVSLAAASTALTTGQVSLPAAPGGQSTAAVSLPTQASSSLVARSLVASATATPSIVTPAQPTTAAGSAASIAFGPSQRGLIPAELGELDGAQASSSPTGDAPIGAQPIKTSPVLHSPALDSSVSTSPIGNSPITNAPIGFGESNIAHSNLGQGNATQPVVTQWIASQTNSASIAPQKNIAANPPSGISGPISGVNEKESVPQSVQQTAQQNVDSNSTKGPSDPVVLSNVVLSNHASSSASAVAARSASQASSAEASNAPAGRPPVSDPYSAASLLHSLPAGGSPSISWETASPQSDISTSVPTAALPVDSSPTSSVTVPAHPDAPPAAFSDISVASSVDPATQESSAPLELAQLDLPQSSIPADVTNFPPGTGAQTSESLSQPSVAPPSAASSLPADLVNALLAGLSNSNPVADAASDLAGSAVAQGPTPAAVPPAVGTSRGTTAVSAVRGRAQVNNASTILSSATEGSAGSSSTSQAQSDQSPFSIFFSSASPGTESAAGTLPRLILPQSNGTSLSGLGAARNTIRTNAQTANAGNNSLALPSGNNASLATPSNTNKAPSSITPGTAPVATVARDASATIASTSSQIPAAVSPASTSAPTPAVTLPVAAVPSPALPVGQPAKAPTATPGEGAPVVAQPPPVAAPGPVQVAQMVNRLGQSEMRIGMNTSAFGTVEVRTTVHASDVGLTIGSEKGDLRALLNNELPAVATTLQQQNLKLSNVTFMQGFSSPGNGGNSGNPQQQQNFAPRTAFAGASLPDSLPQDLSVEMPVSEFGGTASGLSILA